jgi:hypothetical protein
MRFRFMGPCNTVAKIALEPAMSVSSEYTAFWDDVAQNMDAWGAGRDWWFESAPEEFFHAASTRRRRDLAYDTIEQDTSALPACIAHWSVPFLQQDLDERLARVARGLGSSPGLSGLEGTVSARLYHNGIFILQYDLAYDGDSAGLDGPKLEEIESAGIALGRGLADEVGEALAHWARVARDRASHGATMVQVQSRQRETEGTGDEVDWVEAKTRQSALWITRSMILSEADSVGARLEEWLEPAAVFRSWRDSMRDRGYAMEWLRYAFSETGADGQIDVDAWESMLFCQYFWAAVEKAEQETFRILGGSARQHGEGLRPRHWFEALSSARLEAELIMARYRHLRRYAARSRQPMIDEIMEGWNFDELVENLEKSVAICRENLEHMLHHATARSTVWTDLLLFFIGSYAVLDFLISIAVLGRSMNADAMLGLRDEGVFNILATVARLPMDLIISSGFGLIIVAGIVLYRRKRAEIA